MIVFILHRGHVKTVLQHALDGRVNGLPAIPADVFLCSVCVLVVWPQGWLAQYGL